MDDCFFTSFCERKFVCRKKGLLNGNKHNRNATNYTKKSH